jgi:hypothetical protein
MQMLNDTAKHFFGKDLEMLTEVDQIKLVGFTVVDGNLNIYSAAFKTCIKAIM